MAHIVDELIEERAGRLRSNPILWRLIKATLYPVLGYERAKQLTETVREMSGPDVMQHLSNTLRLRIEVSGITHLPTTGRAMLIANHPAGIADGVAVHDAIKSVREDITFFANRDAIRVAPALIENIIPVEWIEEKRTHQRQKETVKRMVAAFRDNRLVVIFPSGRLAHLTRRGLTERPWQTTAVNLAQRYQCPLVPMHISARNSAFFYTMSFLSSELRDITLFHELLNKTNQRYRMQIGEPISPVGDTKELTDNLQTFITQRLPQGETRYRSSGSSGDSSLSSGWAGPNLN